MRSNFSRVEERKAAASPQTTLAFSSRAVSFKFSWIRGAAIASLPNAQAEACGGLLADFAREKGACALVKGVRGGGDLDWETQMAQINRDLCPALDTVLLPARPEHLHISSTGP